ncbi:MULTISPECIES: YoaK family protein [unclassified Clostridium]|uniref:YoaK family protein n=1 Tax=unclassified Clostridium TaxID=2614128 RepID=UPI0013F12845|nr:MULTISPECIES: YoaK family protein [unclassified Clostridium]NFG61154.1 DUF1275 domain-containing protein [Clostridium botulinum]NFQ08900.1 DUF1275 domain-containing protein [Clostridium botulinum]
MCTKDMNINMCKNKNVRTSESVHLGMLLAIVGGFLDAYTFVCRGGVFANAETGNIVLVGVEVTKGNLKGAIMAFLPILAFIIGVIVAETIKEFESCIRVVDSHRTILIIEMLVLFSVGFIPTTIPDIFVTTTISFVSSVQISSFRKLVDSPYSTTMCTGNLRSASQAAYMAFRKKDSTYTIKSIRYCIIIISFLIGACLGGVSTLKIGVKSVWISVVVLICAIVLFSIDERRIKEQS